MYLQSSKLYRWAGHLMAGECLCLKGTSSSFASLPHPAVVHSTQAELSFAHNRFGYTSSFSSASLHLLLQFEVRRGRRVCRHALIITCEPVWLIEMNANQVQQRARVVGSGFNELNVETTKYKIGLHHAEEERPHDLVWTTTNRVFPHQTSGRWVLGSAGVLCLVSEAPLLP